MLPAGEEPAIESIAVPSQQASVVHTSASVSNTIAHWLLQASHRIGAVALLATVFTWVQMYQIKNFHWPLAVAAGASDLGLCLALLARMFVRHNTPLRRESRGIAIFNLVLFVLSIYFMVFARLSVIRANAGEFFTPTEQH
jgi:uncharacterized Tic20 family protein